MRAARRSPGRAARVAGVLLSVGAAALLLEPARFAVPGAAGGATRIDPAPVDAPAPGTASGPRAPTPETDGPRRGTDGGAPISEDDAPVADLRLVELRGGWRDREDLATAVAMAVLVGTAHARAAGGTHVAVEAVEQPGPDEAVVTLLVAPRPSVDGDTPHALRLAVPVRTGAGGVRIAGDPWTLPGPRLDPAPPSGRQVTDPALLGSAAAALAGAGLDPTGPIVLEATDGWPFLAHLDGTADGGPTTVWLRWHLDRFVVAGLPLQSAAGSGRGTGSP